MFSVFELDMTRYPEGYEAVISSFGYPEKQPINQRSSTLEITNIPKNVVVTFSLIQLAAEFSPPQEVRVEAATTLSFNSVARSPGSVFQNSSYTNIEFKARSDSDGNHPIFLLRYEGKFSLSHVLSLLTTLN